MFVSFFHELKEIGAQVLAFLNHNKDAFSSLGTIFAVIIFAFAFYQYRRGESWKKSEFIAKLYKDFMDDMACRNAMWMLDWENRQINFGSEEMPIIENYNYGILIQSLRKHDDIGFTDLEKRIRDTFDRFFMYIEQFERAMQNKLVQPRQVYPYFAYWIDLLGGKRHVPYDVRKCVLEYIEIYGIKDVRRFLDRWPR
ncbi:MAG TPA: hypothetical protein VMH84_06905 [Xanthobacteraceae bacterium]|nr:hypothetical protein [Xanthobacteraceae bacterium]